MSLHIEKEGYTPKEGDLVFFLTNEHAEGNSQIQSNVPGHTGIVTGVMNRIYIQLKETAAEWCRVKPMHLAVVIFMDI